MVLSKNGGVYAIVFDTDNSFVKREQMRLKAGRVQSIELTRLPSTAANYLAQTYPKYFFKKAFLVSGSGNVNGSMVVIDANNTRYAVEFDAAGIFFLKTQTI